MTGSGYCSTVQVAGVTDPVSFALDTRCAAWPAGVNNLGAVFLPGRIEF